MKTIWKFPLELTGVQTVMLPDFYDPLCVQAQNGILCLWALVNPGCRQVPCEIRIVGTGQPFERAGLRYIGTCQIDSFVWHVFMAI